MKTLYLHFFLLSIFSFSCQSWNSTPLTLLISPATGNSALPYLVNGEDGNLYLSWIEKGNDTVTLFYSKWVNGKWDTKQKIASGTNWFVNWADYPTLAVNKFGDILAHYLVKSGGGTYAYDVQVQLFSSELQRWNQPQIIHEDTTQAEHGFVTIIPMENGNFQVTWLDGRYTMGVNHDHTNAGPMTLRTAQMDRSGIISSEIELDNRVCDCCQTNGARLLDEVTFVYRDRSTLETRDIAIVQYVNGNWQNPAIVHDDNWKLAACPVNGPAIDAFEKNMVIAWYTGENGTNQVKVAFSTNAGQQFNDPIVIDQTSPLGRVDVILIDLRSAYLVWLDVVENETYIKGKTVGLDGKLGEEVIIVKSDKSRGTGFPQLAKNGAEIYLAWTNLTDSSSQIQVSKLNLP